MAKQEDKSGWATGGGFMLGLGVGFFVLPISVFAFIGSIIAGIGVGLILSAIIARKK